MSLDDELKKAHDAVPDEVLPEPTADEEAEDMGRKYTNPEPVLVTCPYCKGMHRVGTVEQCPLKPPAVVEPAALRRMDEAATTAIISLASGLGSLNTLQRLYVEAHGKEVLIPGSPLNLSGDMGAIEGMLLRLGALKIEGHRE